MPVADQLRRDSSGGRRGEIDLKNHSNVAVVVVLDRPSPSRGPMENPKSWTNAPRALVANHVYVFPIHRGLAGLDAH